MPHPSLDEALRQEFARRRHHNQLRSRRCIRTLDSTHVEIDGRTCVNFASNNYLGLTHHPRLLAALHDAQQAGGAGSGASPLISGFSPAHAAAEQALARWKSTEAALLLPSGYQAAHAAVGALAAIGALRLDARFLADKLCHASLLDAVAATRCPLRVFPHNGLPKLRRLLDDAPPQQLQVVLTESIFSMDGDCADLAVLADLKSRRDFFLLLDEAHASGVYGPCGAGYAAEIGLQHIVDAGIVTFSKAMGLAGGAVCGSRAFCDAIINWGRAYIYSTSIPPALAAAVPVAMQIMHDEPHRQSRLRDLARRARSRLSAAGMTIPPGDSPIIPIILGSEAAALDAARRLESQSLLAVPIRPPTVPRGTSRLRLTLCCDHTDEELDRLLDVVLRLRSSRPHA